MDARSLHPRGFHPVLTPFSPDLKSEAERIPRFASPTPVKYYFIDFGISVHIPAGRPRLVLGEDGIDRQVPELSSTVPYDPFKVDVFVLGNVVRHEVYAVSSNPRSCWRASAYITLYDLAVCERRLSAPAYKVYDAI